MLGLIHIMTKQVVIDVLQVISGEVGEVVPDCINLFLCFGSWLHN